MLLSFCQHWHPGPQLEGEQGGPRTPWKIFAPLEKCVGHILKVLDIVLKFGPLSESSSLPIVSQAGYGAVGTSPDRTKSFSGWMFWLCTDENFGKTERQ